MFGDSGYTGIGKREEHKERKVRYRGLEKNANRLLLMLGLNNLHRHRETLLAG